ncbi:MAG: glutamine amidotransferase [Deltaproteobacteria bacterium]|jgi:GMP synthase (glutamine-hydrolysing)|nr:glutamine amidotransferase [Deltaproteobacteria bacterium]
MICRVIQHVLFEDLGFFDKILKERGYELKYHQAGVNLPSSEEFLQSDLAIVMGGPIGVGDRELYPFLNLELKFLEKRLKADRPTLGICLGAQLMAYALGAEVYPNTQKEIGWSTLDISPQGIESPLNQLQDTFVLHWHGDTFNLPQGAELLASTKITPNQAFKVGNNILALQFHPEVEIQRIEEWLIGHTCELMSSKMDIVKLRAESQKYGAPLKINGSLLLSEWLKGLSV